MSYRQIYPRGIINGLNRWKSELKINVADATNAMRLIRFTLEPCNFTLNTCQDFVFTYFKQEQQCLWNYRLLKILLGVKLLKTNAECLPSFSVQKCCH